MPRSARHALVLLGPVILVGWPLLRHLLADGTAGPPGRDLVVAAGIAHVAATLLVLPTLVMSGRLTWRAGPPLMIAAGALLWLDLGAVCAVVGTAVAMAIVERIPLADVVWGVSAGVVVANLLSAGLLARMSRRAQGGEARPRRWTLFA